MPAVVTDAASVVCIHQGTLQIVASQRQLTVDGHAALVLTDLPGTPINGCGLTSPGTVPCTVAVSLIAGAATKLAVGGTPVLLDTATGATNSTPPGTWSVRSAGQDKLTAS